MISIRRRLSLLAFLVMLCGRSAFGGDYADPSGFSFTHPEGWIPITRMAMGDVKQALPQELKDWVKRNNVDLSQIAVVLLRDGREDFLENLNVVVEQQQIPVSEDSVKKLTDQLTQRYREMGVTIEDFRGRVQKVGSRDALMFDYQSRIPGVPFALRQRQVMIPGGGKTFIITCSTKADTFNQHAPTFEAILASFQAPAPLAMGFDWSRVGRSAAAWGIAGGVIGGLLAIVRKFTNKAK